MQHSDHHDPRRCDTGLADRWGGCFFCGAIRGEACPEPAAEQASPSDTPAASEPDAFGRSDGSDATL